MSELTPHSPVSLLRGVGPTRSRHLAAAGIETVLDLLFQLPVRYEDRRRRLDTAAVDQPGHFLFRGSLSNLKRVRIRRRGLSLVRGLLTDLSGHLPVIWFNRPYLPSQIREDCEYVLYGQIRARGSGWELVNPTCEPIKRSQSSDRIVAVYASIPSISSTFLNGLLHQALDRINPAEIADPLPHELLRRHALPALKDALISIHEPSPSADVEALNRRETVAINRLAYGEFLELQIEMALVRGFETRRKKPHQYALDRRLQKILDKMVPFTLTDSQQTVWREIERDLAAPYPMLRLLQGDVGCGKTVVAAMAVVAAVESGLQAALMAPTEILAEQHHRSLSALLGDRYELELVTGSVGRSAGSRKRVASGEADLTIGTHALIQRHFTFENLGLAIVDEQHRFGVTQRQLLQSKGSRPDMLVMTATPIPRSLALTLYGDLSLSIIDELPPGRRPITTTVEPACNREKIYSWLARGLSRGEQAYIVFPLIEASDRVAAQSIERRGEELFHRLGEDVAAILHGRTETSRREQIMRRFRDGEIRALISTTVIEVGVDVPAATLMVIESAERFGLAQLHQLRGRVGRGDKPSFCVAMTGERLTAVANRRLEVFARSSDGFEIAEADLEIRGPGDLLGTRQAGLPLFHVADIVRHRRWLEEARRDARDLVKNGYDGGSSDWMAKIRQRADERYRRFAGG